MQTAPDTIDAETIALFLDVDGTLLPIRDNPGDVVADADLLELLEHCSEQLDGAVALISGRPIAEIDRIFSPAKFPVAGTHGAERRLGAGRIINAPCGDLPPSVLDRLQAFSAEHDGLLLEQKSAGVALHYRRAPALESACQQLMEQVTEELGTAFRLIAGKMVFEITSATHNKGAAIEGFLKSNAFLGKTPVFIGDDVTDEDGFRVVNELGGMSIRVGDISTTEAGFRLAAVSDVHAWLQNAILSEDP